MRRSGHQPKPGKRPKTPTTGSGVMKAVKPGTAVMIRQEGNTPASATSTMVALAQDPNFDPVKFQALASFQENMIATQAKLNFNEDFFAMQAALPSISRDGKITIRDKAEKERGNNARVVQETPYATFPNIMRVVKPILQAHNFTLNFTIDSEADGRPKVTGILANNRGGHSLSSVMSLQIDASGSKNNVQGAGSAVAYAKRYITIGLLNLVTHAKEDRDDDGTVAGDAMMAAISGEQVKNLRSMMKQVSTSDEIFCEFWSIEKVEDLALKNFEGAQRILQNKAATKGITLK